MNSGYVKVLISGTAILVSVSFSKGCQLNTSVNSEDIQRAKMQEEIEKDVKENPPPALSESKSFKLLGVSLVADSLKGTFFNNKLEGSGWGSAIDVSGFKKDTDYFYHFSSSKEMAVVVWKKKDANSKWVYDGIRWPSNNFTFLKAGFRNPDFYALWMQPYSYSSNTYVTSAIMTVHGVKNGAFSSSTESEKVYGKAGNNIESFEVPGGRTLKYNGQTVKSFRANTKAAPKLLSFLSALGSSGILDKNNSYAGVFEPKNIGKSVISSNHSWGVAIDLFTADSKGNFLSDAKTGQFIDANPVIKELAEKHDLAWGGYWKGSVYDPMHFELINPNF